MGTHTWDSSLESQVELTEKKPTTTPRTWVACTHQVRVFRALLCPTSARRQTGSVCPKTISSIRLSSSRRKATVHRPSVFKLEINTVSLNRSTLLVTRFFVCSKPTVLHRIFQKISTRHA